MAAAAGGVRDSEQLRHVRVQAESSAASEAVQWLHVPVRQEDAAPLQERRTQLAQEEGWQDDSRGARALENR